MNENNNLTGRIARILNDVNNFATHNPKCNQCKKECKNFISDSLRCLLQKEDNVVTIQHLCSKTSGRVYICLGCNHFHHRKNRLNCTCVDRSQSAVAALPEEDEDESQQLMQYDNCNGAFDDHHTNHSTNKSVIAEGEGMIQAIFDDKTAFNEKSSRFWKNEHKEVNHGKTCIVTNALNNINLSNNDINVALVTTRLHFNVTKESSQDIIELTNQTVRELVKEQTDNTEMFYTCLKESISDVLIGQLKASNESDPNLTTLLEALNITDLTEKITQSTQQKVHLAQRQNTTKKKDLPDSNDIRNKYLSGKKSILQNLPIPDVKMAHGFACVPLEQIVNLFLAMDLPLRYYQVDSDWKDETGEYEGEYFKSLHTKIISDDHYVEGTRAYIARGWSDGFNLHYVKINSDHNNLQIFTVTLLGRKGQTDHTWPFAIGFKQSDHSKILNMFMKQAKELEKPKYRYVGGSEKKLVRVSIHLQAMMNDYIERVSNCVVSQNGNFAHRWGYSCAFCPVTTPSCELCREKRVERILSDSADNKTCESEEVNSDDESVISPCRGVFCDDWWFTFDYQELSKYPVRIEDMESIKKKFTSLRMVPVVKLNFNILKNCVLEVQEYWDKCKLGHSKRPTKTRIKDYFDICGIQQKFSQKMLDRLFDGDGNITEMIPTVWEDIIGSGLDLFVQIPMHLCALGIEKTLIKNTKHFFRGGILLKSSGETFGEFVSEVQEVHNRINHTSIEWLNTQPFTSKDDLAISNWLSDSFFSFTRTSLVLFGILAENEDCNAPAEVSFHQDAFQEVRVLWFCLMSHMFAAEHVSSDTIDDYSRLFLDACVRLNNLTKRKKGKKKKSFFEGTCNFFSILNTKQVIDRHGPIKYLWEGGDGGEKFIQKFKGANCPGFFRHNDNFMMTFMQKVMNSYMLDHINKGNPLCERLSYERALNFEVYNKEMAALSPLTQGIVVSGVIVKERLYICFHQQVSSRNNQVVLKELTFDDEAGQWNYNLFYAPASIEHSKEGVNCENREDVVKQSSDVFALFPMDMSNDVDSEKTCFTLICRSWRIRDDVGKLRLPTPKEKLLRRGQQGYEDGSSMEEDEFEEESNDPIDNDEETNSDSEDEECIDPKPKASRGKKRKL